MDELGIRESQIITWDCRDTLEKEGKTIEILPLWKFLLSG